MFKVNEAGWDRIARIIVGIVLLVVSLSNVVSGGLGIVFIVLGAVLVLTGAIGWCPLYSILRIKTKAG